jgi:hypothetical protein
LSCSIALLESEPAAEEAAAAEPAAADDGGEEWVAEYDYAAADEEEITLTEGDIIINVEAVDDGWVRGTIKATGVSGMMPDNYITKKET